MDIVFIEELRIDAVIGIYDWERRVRQTLSLDIEMAFDNTVPAADDDIHKTLNYKDVSKYRNFKRPFGTVWRVGDGRASAGLGTDRMFESGSSASRGRGASPSVAISR